MNVFSSYAKSDISSGHFPATDVAMSSRITRFPLQDASLAQGVAGVAGTEVNLFSKITGDTDGASLFDRVKLQFRSDEELGILLQAGQADALTVLFERHSALVFRIARGILRDAAEAEDAVQQVFMDVFRGIERFDPRKGTFKTWLLMFVYNRTLNRKRDLRSRGFYDSGSLEGELPEITRGVERPFAFNTSETICLVEEALKLIQPRQRRVIELVYYEGLTADEVAERTGESVRVVRHNLYRGLEKVRSVLQGAASDKSSSNRKPSDEGLKK